MVRDTPLSEITLRKYEKPYDAPKREVIRKVCLSLGLLQPGDSRDTIVDILLVLDEARKNKVMLSSFEIRDKVEALRKQNSLEIKGPAESNIRRQLKRVRDAMIGEKLENKYRLSEFLTIYEIFPTKIEKFFVPAIVERVAIFRTLATMLAGAQEGWRASKTENRLNGEIICRERFSADDEHVLILPIEEKP